MRTVFVPSPGFCLGLYARSSLAVPTAVSAAVAVYLFSVCFKGMFKWGIYPQGTRLPTDV